MGAGFSLQGWRFCSVNYKIRAIHTYRLVFYRLVFSPLKCLWNSARMMFQMIIRLTSHSHRVRITCNSFKMKKLFTYALPWCRKEQNWSTSWFSMWTQGIHRTGCHPPPHPKVHFVIQVWRCMRKLRSKATELRCVSLWLMTWQVLSEHQLGRGETFFHIYHCSRWHMKPYVLNHKPQQLFP